MAQTYAIACYRQESVDSNMKLPKLTCVAAVLMLLLSMGFTATAQQKDPWKSKLCKEHIGSCGILVTFNLPIEDVLSVTN